MKRYIVMCGLLWAAGCGDRRGGDADEGGGAFCREWATGCPGDVDEDMTVDDCISRCEVAGDMTWEKCWFAACSVETGLCDNQDDGSISECAASHGWQ